MLFLGVGVRRADPGYQIALYVHLIYVYYCKVDDNVTRHITSELSKDDWSMMILHYLGLDHIGHLIGPTSSLLPPKLTEMDQIVHLIQSTLKMKVRMYIPTACLLGRVNCSC